MGQWRGRLDNVWNAHVWFAGAQLPSTPDHSGLGTTQTKLRGGPHIVRTDQQELWLSATRAQAGRYAVPSRGSLRDGFGHPLRPGVHVPAVFKPRTHAWPFAPLFLSRSRSILCVFSVSQKAALCREHGLGRTLEPSSYIYGSASRSGAILSSYSQWIEVRFSDWGGCISESQPWMLTVWQIFNFVI